MRDIKILLDAIQEEMYSLKNILEDYGVDVDDDIENITDLEARERFGAYNALEELYYVYKEK